MPTGQLALHFGLEAAAQRDAVWFDNAIAHIYSLGWGTRFTSDELRDAIGSPNGSGNACGAAIRHAHDIGLIAPDGARPSRRAEARGRVIVIWRRLQEAER